MKRIALTFLALAVASVARAEFLTGNDLLAKLADKADNMNYALGLGYVGGVHDAGKTVVHCSPAAVTMGQIGDMTRMRLEHDPETRNLSADMLILNMLKTAWPCAKKASPTML